MLSKLFGSSKEDSPSLDPKRIPKHVAIIMDGNGRWAKRRGLPRKLGHRAGADVLTQLVRTANDLGIQALTVYGFSTENWKRPEEEVSLLMRLIHEYLTKNVEEMHREGVRIRFIGLIEELSPDLQTIIDDAQRLTANNEGLCLQLAINYGGRAEIVSAAKAWAKDVTEGRLQLEDLREETFSTYLYTQEFSDVDLLIRPSGDYRISNFLLWQLAYAEFWFTDLMWPEFTGETLKAAIADFQRRERRFGGLLDSEG